MFANMFTWAFETGRKIYRVFSSVWDNITIIAKKIGEALGNAFKNLGKSILSFLTKPINWIIDQINKLLAIKIGD